jgi:hypothetical protein
VALNVKAQTPVDSVQAQQKRKQAIYSAPRKASILSAILPGAGQVYNRKSWKVPIIYAGIGGFGYYFYFNNGYYNDYRRALIESDKGPGFATVDGRSYSTENLLILKNEYKRQRDLGVVGILAFYLLNIVDANVDAHLRTFDVSDDLSLNIRPWLGNQQTIGLTFQLHLK